MKSNIGKDPHFNWPLRGAPMRRRYIFNFKCTVHLSDEQLPVGFHV